LDGVRSHNSASPSEPSRATFASTLKLGLGSHGSGKQSISEPEPALKHEISESPEVVLKGEPSNLTHLLPSSGSSVQSNVPSMSIDELSACCLLGKMWGESVPIASIIHRTQSEWKFTKGQIDYVDLGND